MTDDFVPNIFKSSSACMTSCTSFDTDVYQYCCASMDCTYEGVTTVANACLEKTYVEDGLPDCVLACLSHELTLGGVLLLLVFGI
mmetsp:Transcript_21336/g.20475  ORF Transcript_21336/g.20475 Transcript_21336/m.20475 type:complete len:85 (-) Transcript_21336:70-324(-)